MGPPAAAGRSAVVPMVKIKTVIQNEFMFHGTGTLHPTGLSSLSSAVS